MSTPVPSPPRPPSEEADADGSPAPPTRARRRRAEVAAVPPAPAPRRVRPEGEVAAAPPAPAPAPRPVRSEPEIAASPRPPVVRSRPAPYAHIVLARFVAFGALAALVAAVAYLVATSGRTPTPSLVSVAARGRAAHKARFWVVRPGQTLSYIGTRERVSVTELERLNPGLVPATLGSGQRVKLPG